MANRPAIVSKADVRRTVEGALAAGLRIREVIASAEGVRVICDNGSAPQEKGNSFDEVLT
ncbi:hypothetical protein [Roseibium aggregatum]|uniref:hypothetical protein n=1 Tax=Roseibium aggregatum TaxID=187304 RepID=UPI003A97FFB2